MGNAGEPRISVVIPVFNREATIERAIDSVLAQTLGPAEIVVVDDGSTDGTADAIARYGDRVRHLHQRNAGASAARNLGVRCARSEWVAFLDSDDHWVPGHLAAMVDAIGATRGAAGFYFADCHRPASEGSPSLWDLSGFPRPVDRVLVDDATDWVLMALQPMMLQASVIARDRYLAAGGLWPALRTRHDTHLWFVLGIAGPACAVAGGGARMTADDGGHRLTEAHGPATRDWWVQTRLMYEDVLRRFPRLPPHHRRELRSRLATAEVRLAEDAWHTRRAGAAVAHLLRGGRVAPRHVASSAGRRVGRNLRGGNRSPLAVPGRAAGGDAP